MKKILLKILFTLCKKETISMRDFANKVESISKKYNKNHWKVECSMDGFGNTQFKAYVQGFWTADFNSIEKVLESLVNFCEPKSTNQISEVIV